jgi:hypothetical protein
MMIAGCMVPAVRPRCPGEVGGPQFKVAHTGECLVGGRQGHQLEEIVRINNQIFIDS